MEIDHLLFKGHVPVVIHLQCCKILVNVYTTNPHRFHPCLLLKHKKIGKGPGVKKDEKWIRSPGLDLACDAHRLQGLMIK